MNLPPPLPPAFHRGREGGGRRSAGFSRPQQPRIDGAGNTVLFTGRLITMPQESIMVSRTPAVKATQQQPTPTENRELLEMLHRLEQQHTLLLHEMAELQRKLGHGELLPLKVAAAEVGYNQETVRLWVSKRRIAGERRGGRWFINQPSLQAYCASMKAG